MNKKADESRHEKLLTHYLAIGKDPFNPRTVVIEQKFCTHDAVQEEHAKDAELSISFLECGRDEPVEEGGHLLSVKVEVHLAADDPLGPQDVATAIGMIGEGHLQMGEF